MERIKDDNMKVDIHELINSLQELEKAHELLYQVYLDIGPYQDKVDPVVWNRVCEYCKFNDDE